MLTDQVADKQLSLDIAEARQIVLPLFLEGSFSQAEKLCISARSRPDATSHWLLYHALISSGRALLLFDGAAFERAVATCNEALAACTREIEGTKSHALAFTALFSSRPQRSRLQEHATLNKAIILILRALVVAFSEADLLALLQQIMNLRTAYSILNALQQETYSADEELKSGIAFALGILNLVTSLLPSNASNVLSFLGYEACRSVALGRLEDSAINSKGIYAALSKLVLFSYHFILAPLLYLQEYSSSPVSVHGMLNEAVEEYPNSLFFGLFKNKRLALQRQPASALISYQTIIHLSPEAKSAQFACEWECGMAQMASCDWASACLTFGKLSETSNWSPIICAYLKAVSHQATLSNGKSAQHGIRDLQHMYQAVLSNAERKRKSHKRLMRIETFVIRKATQFLERQRLIAPHLEIALVLRTFGIMTADVLSRIVLPTLTGLTTNNADEEVLVKVGSSNKVHAIELAKHSK